MTSRTLHLSLICRFGSAPIDTFRVNLVNKRLVCDEEGTAYQVNVSAPPILGVCAFPRPNDSSQVRPSVYGRISDRSGIAPKRAALLPSAAVRTCTFPQGVQACFCT